MQCRPCWLNQHMPLHFKDVLPEPLMPLPPPGVQTSTVQSTSTPTSNFMPTSSPISPSTSVMEGPVSLILSSIWCTFRTQKNKFGLYQVYHTESIPSHDPDDPFSTANKCTYGNAPAVLENPFHPYLNENSMCLGEWFWNQGAQKSKERLQELLDIVEVKDFIRERLQRPIGRLWTRHWAKTNLITNQTQVIG